MKLLKLIMNLLTGAVYLCIFGYLAIAAPLVLGHHPVVVLSGSMEPTYHVGSVIYYKAASFADIDVGDPITFRSSEDGAMVTHRVVEKDETAQAFGTEGDANGSRDPGMVPYTHVVGKASSFCIPYAGYFVNVGRQPAFIAAVALIILASILFDKLYEMAEKKPETVGADAARKPKEASDSVPEGKNGEAETDAISKPEGPAEDCPETHEQKQ